MKIFALFLVIFALVSSAVAIQDDACGLQHSVVGPCKAYMPFWSFKADSGDCVKFHYGGCEGNDNRFNSHEECEATCKQ